MECKPALSELGNLRLPNFNSTISGDVFSNGNLGSGLWSSHPTYIELLGKNYQYHERKWAPLVAKDMGLTCAVDILFLRRGARGGVMNVGDIDGRLKTLFDALAIPKSDSELPAPEATQPIYVLLNDDRHISHASVETDELLEPTSLNSGLHDARVIITVNIKPLISNYFTLGFSAL